MGTARFSPEAERDIEAIWDHTEARWGRDQAERYLRDLQAVCTGLANGSLPGRSAGDIRAGYGEAACGSHMVYFRREGEDTIIVRILHQGMDVERHL